MLPTMKTPRLRGRARRTLGLAKTFVGRMVGSSRLEAAGVIDELIGRLECAGQDAPARHIKKKHHEEHGVD